MKITDVKDLKVGELYDLYDAKSNDPYKANPFEFQYGGGRLAVFIAKDAYGDDHFIEYIFDNFYAIPHKEPVKKPEFVEITTQEEWDKVPGDALTIVKRHGADYEILKKVFWSPIDFDEMEFDDAVHPYINYIYWIKE